jgi:UDP-N-acetylglucosamine 3-dehydrogenase
MNKISTVAIIGFGVMGKNHFRALNELQETEVVAVFDENTNNLKNLPSKIIANSIEELSETPIDYCVIAVPTSHHEQVALKIADLGFNALIEKPIANDSESAVKIKDTFAKRNLALGVGHIERFNPSIMEAKKRLLKKELGKIYQISTRRQNGFPVRISDVGVVKDLATHDIDLTMFLSDSDYSKIFSRASYRSGRESEDLISVTAELENGIIVNHLVNWVSPFKERVVTVLGEKGAFVCDTLLGDLTFYENASFESDWDSVINFRGASEGSVTRYSILKKEPLKVEHLNFIDYINGIKDVTAIVTADQGIKVLKIAELILRQA